MLTIMRNPDWRVASVVFMLLGPLLGVVVLSALAGSVMSGLFALKVGLLFGPLFLIFVYVAGALPALAAMAGFLLARRHANLVSYIFLSAAGGAICEAFIKPQARWLDVAAPAVTAGLCALITLAISPQKLHKSVGLEAPDDGKV